MIGLKHKESISLSGLHNALAAGTVIKGNISTESDFRLDGKIEGDVTCKGRIVVGPKGHVVGKITAPNAEILGKVDGNIHVHSKLTLRSSAIINGDIFIQLVEIEPNAQFNGACNMIGTGNHKNIEAPQKKEN